VQGVDERADQLTTDELVRLGVPRLVDVIALVPPEAAQSFRQAPSKNPRPLGRDPGFKRALGSVLIARL